MSAECSVPARVVGYHLMARDLRRLLRYPTTSFRILFFPVFFVIVVSGTFASAAKLPGFPARSLLDWILPIGFVAGAVAAAGIPVFAMARDIESGFFDRLVLSSADPMGLLLGPILAALVRALVPFAIVVCLGLLAGVRLLGGPAGLVTALLAAEGTALCAVTSGVGLGLRLGSVRRTIGPIQIINFAVLYISTAQVPPSLMAPWLRAAARVNPMSQVLALARQGFLGPVTWGQTWPGLAVLCFGSALLMLFAVRGLSGRGR
ncbi:MAG: ABC transporter permease [Actinomycetota bacterium]|nr:ABC transporter permease [Actinomycetota bacterium]